MVPLRQVGSVYTKKRNEMKTLSSIMTLFFLIAFSGCANANVSRNREAYILSQPHGWIKIAVTDSSVPSALPPRDLKSDQKTEWEPRPPSCSFIIKLNNERFLYETIFPFGENPPYKVDTGFRFSAPVGEFDIEILYTGCDVENDETASISISAVIEIIEDLVVPISFNGERFEINEPFENTEITLEDIYQKLVE